MRRSHNEGNAPVFINSNRVERVPWFRFLRISKDLSRKANITALMDKAQQWSPFLRRLKMSPLQVLPTSYSYTETFFIS